MTDYKEYTEWSEVPSNLKTKNQLKGLHLVPGSDEWDGLIDNEEYPCVVLFDMNKAISFIPKVKNVIPAVALSPTQNNIMLALQRLRESKWRRENATIDFPNRARYQKNAKMGLEELENKTLEKLKRDGIEVTYPEKFEKIKVKDAVATLEAYLTSSAS